MDYPRLADPLAQPSVMSGSSSGLLVWKRVTVAVGAVFVISSVTSLSSVDTYTLVRLAIMLLALNGLAGFAWQRAVLKRWVWQALVVFQGIGLAISILNVIAILNTRATGVTLGGWLVTIMLLLLQGILVLGLYLYAYRSPYIWTAAKLESRADD